MNPNSTEPAYVTEVRAPTCTCDGRQQFVCHDMRNEPHLVSCPRWGTPRYDKGGIVPPLCGECDERWIETPNGLAKCPRCYPYAKEA